MRLHLPLPIHSSAAASASAARHDPRSLRGEAPRDLVAAIGSAVRAPSGHNTQPWRIRLTDRCVEVYADRSRALPVVDPDDRALTISCGAAVGFLVVALRHAGRAADVVLLPDPDNPDLLATVGLGHRHVPSERDNDLFAAIDRRHTHRAAFESRAVPADVLTTMTAAADRVGARLGVVLDEETKAQVAELVAAGDREQMADPRFRTELASWVRSNYTRRGDGIPGYAFGIPGLPSLVGPLFMRLTDMGERQAVKDAELTATAPALLLLTTPGDTPMDWLSAGRAVGDVLLTAASAGLAASFLNQPIETTALRPRLGELLATGGDQPQLLLRLGYPATPDRATPRRPLADVLVAPAEPAGPAEPEPQRGGP